MSWTDDVARFLLDASVCPRCHTRHWAGAAAMRQGVCARCGADVSGEAGAALWAASEAVVEAARARQALVDALPTVTPPTTPSLTTPVARTTSPAVGSVPTERPRSAVSLQSVLAVVGAGLLAVAAIVFTFLNPDLTDFATRTSVIAVVTLAFLTGAWVLRARGLAFSAEAIGALGMVFVALDIWAFSRLAPDGVSAWFFGALGVVVSGAALVAAGVWRRMRTWVWAGLAGLVLVPAFVGYGAGEQLSASDAHWWAALWGHVGVFVAGWMLLELTHALERPMGRPLRAEVVALTVLQWLALVVVVPSVLLLPGAPAQRELAVAGVLAVLAATALITTRRALARLWSAVGTVLATGALVASVWAAHPPEEAWFALVGAAVAVPLVIVALVRRTGPVHRRAAAFAALVGAGIVALPLALRIAGGGLELVEEAWRSGARIAISPDAALWNASAVAGLALIVGAVWALSRGTTHASTREVLRMLAGWGAAVVAAGMPLAVPGPAAAAIAVSLAISVLASLALVRIPSARHLGLGMRAPLIAVAHGAILEAVLLSWPDERVAAVTGAAAVLALALASRTVAPRIRPLHTAFGFGYALIAGATALGLTTLEPLPILCLVTSAAAIVALLASLTSRIPVGSWYAVLGVTAVPFAIGVVSVAIERSGWTALSTGVIAMLAIALTLTRRPGTTVLLRAGGAALIVPSLAVVVVCLTAEFLSASGSPYALPVIAALVACALPTTGLVRAALARRGYGAAAADAVRLALEASSLVTGGIAVLLALVRVAAGLEIAFIVLLVLGLGAAATAVWMRRSYGWWTAAAAWTGALWCVWAIAGVTVVEPFVLPPAVAAMTVGAVLASRRRSGDGSRAAAALFATGLGLAIVPTLALVTFADRGVTASDSDVVFWRAGALIAAGVVSTLVAGAITRGTDAAVTRFEAIRVPLLVGAVVAASAGAALGVRLGLELDALPVEGAHRMVQVLGLALLAAATAASVVRLARVAGARSRWLHAATLVLLVAGPIAAIDADPVSIWMLWSLELVLLSALVVSVWRSHSEAPTLPPVWFQWALAWVVAVAAWSPREILRVEGFSLPLGFALVAAGAIVLVRGRGTDSPGTIASWPLAHGGSWRLLGPGIVATLLPSVIATFTSPDTWRAILVIALALVAVLVGARKTLAAPFLLGISTLPLEIAVVFLVQLGTAINPLLWWITLATAGAVLLVIAVGWERRTGADASLAARIRDLR